jgi:hypothetical protein
MAKPVSQLTTRGSAVTVWAFQARRLLVVLTEGHDLCLRTGRSASEFCEIEKQGGLVMDRSTRLYALWGGRQTWDYGLTLTT